MAVKDVINWFSLSACASSVEECSELEHMAYLTTIFLYGVKFVIVDTWIECLSDLGP